MKRSYIKRHTPLKRTGFKRTTKPFRRTKSPRKKIIDKVKAEMKRILRLQYGNRCFFCDKPNSYFRYDLSLFHILPVGSHPRLECVIENTLLACWSKEYYYKTCHNVWEQRQQPYRDRMEEQLLSYFGKDYKDNLLIVDKVNPPLNRTRAEVYLEYYKGRDSI